MTWVDIVCLAAAAFALWVSVGKRGNTLKIKQDLASLRRRVSDLEADQASLRREMTAGLAEAKSAIEDLPRLEAIWEQVKVIVSRIREFDKTY